MGLTRDDSRFKIYAGDTGLFVTMSFWDKAHASLDAFCERYPARVGERYLFYTKDLAREGRTVMIPFLHGSCRPMIAV